MRGATTDKVLRIYDINWAKKEETHFSKALSR